MYKIIEETTLRNGYITLDRLNDSDNFDNSIVSIIEHKFDLNFIVKQMKQNIDLLITYDKEKVDIATKGNNSADNLIKELAKKLNMKKSGCIEPQPHFNFTVVTLSK